MNQEIKKFATVDGASAMSCFEFDTSAHPKHHTKRKLMVNNTKNRKSKRNRFHFLRRDIKTKNIR